jgi:biopolymer transport protein TolR
MNTMRRQRKAINQINVVPYIDVMLVLLVIFMITAPLINQGEIELPSVGSQLKVPVAPLEVSVTAVRTYTLSDRATQETVRKLSGTQLADLLLAKQRRNPDQAVVISATPTTPYGEVVTLLDTLQRQGIKRVGLLAKQQQN